MATPARRNIITFLREALEGIATPTDKSDVRTTSLTVADWETARVEGEFPYIGIKPGACLYRYLPGGNIRNSWTVELACHVNASTDKERYDQLEDLLDDIIVAVSADPTLQENAISVTVVSDITDEGDPDTMDHRGGSGSMVVTLRIDFMRGVTAS